MAKRILATLGLFLVAAACVSLQTTPPLKRMASGTGVAVMRATGTQIRADLQHHFKVDASLDLSHDGRCVIDKHLVCTSDADSVLLTAFADAAGAVLAPRDSAVDCRCGEWFATND
ncbi:MAG: hypothetical protein ABR543_01505 [Gemmatimonadaceae bacterium]